MTTEAWETRSLSQKEAPPRSLRVSPRPPGGGLLQVPSPVRPQPLPAWGGTEPGRGGLGVRTARALLPFPGRPPVPFTPQVLGRQGAGGPARHQPPAPGDRRFLGVTGETSNRRSHAPSADHQAVTARPARPVLGKRNRGGAKAARSGEAAAPRFLPFLRPRKGPPSGSPPLRPQSGGRAGGHRAGRAEGPEAARAGSGGCHSDRGVQPGPAPTTRGFGRGPDRKSSLPG